MIKWFKVWFNRSKTFLQHFINFFCRYTRFNIFLKFLPTSNRLSSFFFREAALDLSLIHFVLNLYILGHYWKCLQMWLVFYQAEIRGSIQFEITNTVCFVASTLVALAKEAHCILSYRVPTKIPFWISLQVEQWMSFKVDSITTMMSHYHSLLWLLNSYVE